MANVYVGDIIAIAEVILRVCDQALSSERRPGPIYWEFRRCVHQWSCSFRHLSQIIENAAEQRKRYSGYFHDDTPAVDEAALKEIIDDCNSTLRECRVALEDARPHAQRSDPLNQYFFNEQKRPKIEQLTARIKSHDARLSAFLKPFEVEILQRLCNNVGEIHAVIVRGVTVEEVRRNTNRSRIYKPQHSLPVPDAFGEAFQAQQDQRSSDSSADVESIAFWAEPLAVHLRNSTQRFQWGGFSIKDRTVRPEQYINLLKCLWILKRLESHPKLCNPAENSLWPSYISHLAAEVSKQCRRFSEDDLLAPSPLRAEQSLCEIWIKPLTTEILPAIHHESGAVNVVMIADLHSERRGATATLELVRVSDVRMRITMIGVDRSNGRDSEIQQKTIEFDINSVRLIPLYAMPGSDRNPFGVRIKTEADQVNPIFSKIGDVLRFQQALTGFKAYANYSEGPVTVLLVLENNVKLKRRAFLQLWVHDELVGMPDVASSPTGPHAELRRTASDTTSTPRKKSVLNWLGRKPSNASEKFERPGVIDRNASPTAPFPRGTMPGSISGNERPSFDPSSRSDAPSRKDSAWSTMTRVNLENGAHGWLHSKPKEPMLVLFLQDESPNRNGDGLSFLTIRIDLFTDVAPDRCDCRLRRPRGQRIGDFCTHAAIEQNDKKLLQAQMYESEDLLEWDVNQLGLSRRQELPKNQLDGLIRVNLMFGPPGDADAVDRRKYFTGSCDCQPLKARELDACLARHKSLFREVKELGRRRLMSWRDAMNSREEILTGEEARRALQAMEDAGSLTTRF